MFPSSGAPRNIEGIVSIKELEVATVTMNKAKIKGEVNFSNKGDNESMIKLTVFGCNPGMQPVIQPKNKPNRIAKNI